MGLYSESQLLFVKQVCGQYLQLFGYSPQVDLSVITNWNAKMLEYSIKASSMADYSEKSQIVVNRKSEIIRQKTEEDPAQRGQRKFKFALAAMREAMK